MLKTAPPTREATRLAKCTAEKDFCICSSVMCTCSILLGGATRNLAVIFFASFWVFSDENISVGSCGPNIQYHIHSANGE
ncbi:hypothetical protein AX774_g5105 [Zancudomyces culisetae]|uniref:Uncharacterized protein n=1 Tax=Zancudomyces culisetae TaxID=1213189 RepID=A0A1R1PKG4_ZANCU|nr:hypothetical protein AX774_g5105 [Zancudomyces culisetae]|eukprot:OMH81429.1 hypothetical protein AX774_g5105 [Zancudomyces culisetae]